MGMKVLLQRKRLAAIFVSLTILIMGAASLMENMTIDYYSVVDTLQKVIPASIVLGGLGWVMGMILDKPKTRGRKKSYSNIGSSRSIRGDVGSLSVDNENSGAEEGK